MTLCGACEKTNAPLPPSSTTTTATLLGLFCSRGLAQPTCPPLIGANRYRSIADNLVLFTARGSNASSPSVTRTIIVSLPSAVTAIDRRCTCVCVRVLSEALSLEILTSALRDGRPSLPLPVFTLVFLSSDIFSLFPNAKKRGN